MYRSTSSALQPSGWVMTSTSGGTGLGPMALDGCAGNPESICRLFLGQAGEVAELHEPCLDRVLGFEFRQSFVKGEEVHGGGRGRDVDGVDVLPLQPAAVPLGSLAAGVLDEDTPYRLGRCREEMPAPIPPLSLLAIDQAEVGLVDQGGRLERLPRLLPGEPLLGELPELSVDEGEELLRCPGVTLLDGREDAGDVVHRLWSHGQEVRGRGDVARCDSKPALGKEGSPKLTVIHARR